MSEIKTNQQKSGQNRRGVSSLKRLLGVRWNVAKIKILRQLISDWRTLVSLHEEYDGKYVGDSLREFAENNFRTLVEHAKKVNTWDEFYKGYRY